ncbi:MAG: type II secretion system F family protein [Pseudomonadota bacterium]|nr:type II secretion system F family protein [Pseudomonadota bacterium]
MPEFAYKAANAEGSIIKGSQVATDEVQLAARLQAQGLFLIEARQDKLKQLLNRLDDFAVGGLSRRDLVEFSNNLSVMLRAGVPLVRSLDELGSDSDNKVLRKALKKIVNDIMGGDGFSQALTKSGAFPKLFVSLAEIGEQSGNLDRTLSDMAIHYKKIDELIRNVRKALIYPCFIMLALFLAAYVFLAKVFPPLFELLTQFDVPLPTVTKVIMAISESFQDYGLWYALAIVLFVVLFIAMRSRDETKRYLDWLEFNLPPMGKLFIQMRMAFFMRYMALISNAGIDLIRGLKMSLLSINNLVFQETMERARQKIIEGSLFSDALREGRYVPRMTIRMIAVGEESGTLPEQMNLVAEYYSEDLERKIATALAMLEPMLLFAMGGLALALVMGILLPLYNLVSELSSSVGSGGGM